MKHLFKLLIFAVTMLMGAGLFAQPYYIPFATKTPPPPANWFAYTNVGLKVEDSVWLVEYAQGDTNKVLTVSSTGRLVMVTKTNGATIDTTSLSNRINEKVSKSDSGASGANKYVTPTGVRTIGDAVYAPLTRSISTTYPLAGGANLSADRTFTLDTSRWHSIEYYNTVYAPISGSGNYINNASSIQTARYNITNKDTFTATIQSKKFSAVKIGGAKRTDTSQYHYSGIQTDLDGAFDFMKNIYGKLVHPDTVLWYTYDATKSWALMQMDSDGNAAWYRGAAGTLSETVGTYANTADLSGAKFVALMSIADVLGIGSRSAEKDIIFTVSPTSNNNGTNAMWINGHAGTSVGWVSVSKEAPKGLFDVHNENTENDAMVLSSDGITIPFTDITVSGEVYTRMAKASTANGGYLCQGFSNGNNTPFDFQGHIGTTSPTTAAFTIRSYKSSGATRTALTGNEVSFIVNAGDATQALKVEADGDVIATTSFMIGTTKWSKGAGDPNGVLTGSPGDIYSNTAGGAGTTLYIKESGSATNTGWVGK